MFAPVFDAVSTEETEANLVKVDIDEERDIAIDAGVQGVPTIIAYKDGKEVSRFSGFQPKENLEQFIKSVK